MPFRPQPHGVSSMSNPDRQQRSTILIVDDMPENIAVLSELLGGEYVVRAANDGERALQVAVSEPQPDLILLDIIMPDLDGHAVLKRLRANPVTRDIPVIFVTALDSCDDEYRGLELGAVDYISKPIQPAIVLARVRNHLELKHARDRLHDENLWLEAELAWRNRQREAILMSVSDGICGIDLEDRFTFVNSAAATMLGYASEELVGLFAHATLHGWPAGNEKCAGAACPLNDGPTLHKYATTFRRKDGSLFEVEMSREALRDASMEYGAVLTFQDIGERKRYVAEIERKANFDEITGLPNRNLLRDRLDQALDRTLRAHRHLVVMVLNLDRFRSINDTLGHDAGDKILRKVAQRLRLHEMEFDTLARTEGDEFVLVMEVEEVGSATRQLPPLLKSLAMPFHIGQHDLFLSASIGLAVGPTDGRTRDALIQNASAAMYQVKKSGGDGFVFYEASMNALAMERLNLENDLRRALECNELVLHYQPQVNLHNGRIIGGEALVRWHHPERGIIPPAEFIPIAEDSGLIVPLGEWVMRTACRQNAAWQADGLPPITVAVNLAARQIAVQDLVQLARKILQETGLEPKYLELELTESAVLADADAFITATERLKGLSITLSIDDFGTGFSSLSYLKRFAIDRLKIDRSFVRDLTQDPSSAAIAVAIISLSHSLGLSVIAEGVETEAQLNFLRVRHCDEIQGFFFSKPLPENEFAELLRSGRTLTLPHDKSENGRCLLLVDDEPSILASLRRLLRREGYTILTAESGEAGLEVMANHPVDVIISDARMPGMSGAEFLGRVREMYPDTIRIMLSGYTDIESVTKAVNRGELFRFLTKPWDDQELLDIIRNAFLQHERRMELHAYDESTTPAP